MREVLVIGSGVAGMSCAVRCAEHGLRVTLVSPFPSERAQSVMAQGGINAVTAGCEEGDSVASHIEDTLKGGCLPGERKAVENLCGHAAEIIRYLERIGTVFSVDGQGRPQLRALGGQSHKRTHYCGTSTGKQIVSALVMEVRRFEADGTIRRRLGCCFHSALIRDGACHGAILFDERTGRLEAVCADAVVVATGGQNALFGKTTGSSQCDGYAAGKLFMQGAELKNLEFIQFHPTTLETAQKRMLISEAVRGEGGRLFFMDGDRRVYFMEDRFGPEGNLMTRDVVSRAVAAAGKQVYLDVSFLGEKTVDRLLPEVRELCRLYRGIDPAREPIPVAPAVHFFMGGLAVRLNHETSVRNLFAAGECAAIYHGANRLGGNSLLAAVHGGITAADAISGRTSFPEHPDFSAVLEAERRLLQEKLDTRSPFPSMYILDMMAGTVREHLGILRNAEGLRKGLESVDQDLVLVEKIRYDSSVLPYFNYRLPAMLALARAALACAAFRTESRGAHFRTDCPETDETFAHASLISYGGGSYDVRLDREGTYES